MARGAADADVGSSGGMNSGVAEANVGICGGWKGSVGCWKARYNDFGVVK